MPNEKLTRLRRCRQAQQRTAMALGEVLLAWALHDEYGVVADRCARHEGENGKPLLEGHDGIRFNLSHSGRYVLVGIDGAPVGVDIQIRGCDDERLACKVMPARTFEAWLDAPDRAAAFCDFWVRRECELKWWGIGIGGLGRTDLSLSEGVGIGMVESPPGYSAAACGASIKGRSSLLSVREVSADELLAWSDAGKVVP